MKSFKKIIFVILALSAIFILCTVTAYADDYGNFSYSTVEPSDGETFDTYNEINGYSADDESTDTVVNIPDAIDDVAITKIAASAFANKTSLTEVIIPNTVTVIDNGAFFGCTSLKVAIIPDSVTTIGDSAFQNCSSLEYLVIGNSVIDIGDVAFKGCSSLSVLSIGSKVEKIGNGAFFDCESLKNVVIPTSVTAIGSNAFGKIQDGNTEKVTDGFNFYILSPVSALDSYIATSDTALAGDVSSPTASGFNAPIQIAECADDSHDINYKNVRLAVTDSFEGLDIAQCSKCFKVLTRVSTETAPSTATDSALQTLIIAIVIVLVIVVFCVLYIKKSKKRRLKAIELYKEGKELPDKEERDKITAQKDEKYAAKRSKQEEKVRKELESQAVHAAEGKENDKK